MAKDGS
ncbi:c4f8efec-6d8e-4c3f-90f7-fbd81d64f857 [Thermothielavioides terrestris]|nr:c4f8efec-6d8e-4c3f-90f7-fbd81d64f857 [Thermothielavioides terrestris]